MMNLIIKQRGGPERRQQVEAETINIGRVKTNDVVLFSPSVSKFHARIIVKNGRFVLVDNNSTNGTFVNGQRIVAPKVIHPGDKIHVGDFTINLDPQEAKAPAAKPITAQESAGPLKLAADVAEGMDSNEPPPPPDPDLEQQLQESGVFSYDKMDELLADAPDVSNLSLKSTGGLDNEIDKLLAGGKGPAADFPEYIDELIDDTAKPVTSAPGPQVKASAPPAEERKEPEVIIRDLQLPPEAPAKPKTKSEPAAKAPVSGSRPVVAPPPPSAELPFDSTEMSHGPSAVRDENLEKAPAPRPAPATAALAAPGLLGVLMSNPALLELYGLPDGRLIPVAAGNVPAPAPFPSFAEAEKAIKDLARAFNVNLLPEGQAVTLGDAWELTLLKSGLRAGGAFVLRRQPIAGAGVLGLSEPAQALVNAVLNAGRGVLLFAANQAAIEIAAGAIGRKFGGSRRGLWLAAADQKAPGGFLHLSEAARELKPFVENWRADLAVCAAGSPEARRSLLALAYRMGLAVVLGVRARLGSRAGNLAAEELALALQTGNVHPRDAAAAADVFALGLELGLEQGGEVRAKMLGRFRAAGGYVEFVPLFILGTRATERLDEFLTELAAAGIDTGGVGQARK